MKNAKKSGQEPALGAESAGGGPIFVPLEALEPEQDDAELQDEGGSEPAQDSPGDDAVLEQEELYEGISSEGLPSSRHDQH